MIVTLERQERKTPPAAGPLRIPYADYRKLPGFSISQILEMAQSPKAFQHRLKNLRKDTKALRLGRIAHTAVLEPMQFLREYVLMPAEFPDKQGKPCKATLKLNSCKAWVEEQEAAGKSIVKESELRTAEEIRDAVMSHAVAAPLLAGGVPEASITWTDPETGIPRRGRVDYMKPGQIHDLKTTRHLRRTAFGRDAKRLMYHVRMASYGEGVEILTGDWPEARIIAVEAAGAHDLVVYRMRRADLDEGRNIYRSLMRQLAECLEKNHWPGVAEASELDLDLSSFTSDGRMDLESMTDGIEITSGGEPMVF